ncbi:unconventional myosin-XVIIIa isoform X3 [Lates calcarifer]|uniref:Unconventional myosin-XVIIIa isoform X3 n=1 Tax=Lates calcarifer TaxID=8187 RepID=A0AAJ8AWL9_LATCA|nr:unconventional myosin-XVIIIa isoform X3 [Lates calcarifer]
MFNLMKKDKEREGSRKEKKDKKERMSAAELRSLEEMSMRRGFFNLKREAKRESKNKLEISNPIPIKVASSNELTLTDIESDGLSNRSSMVLDDQLSAASSTDDLKGEGGGGQDGHRSSVHDRVAHFGSLAKQNSSQVGQMMKRFSFSQRSKEESPSEGSTPSGQNSAAPSPHVESKVFSMLRKQSLKQQPEAPATKKVCIPEVVDKTFPAQLQLPAVVAPSVPETRELELQRRNTGDFGFSLRRTTMLDRSLDGGVYRRVVHFAEPGAGTKDLALGLVPGDRLVEINGRNVENKTRDEIVEMIRQSGDTVRLKVQPILELSELSRCWLRNTEGLRRETRHIKEENKPGSTSSDSDGLPNRAKSVPALDPGRGLFQAKSPPPVSSMESVARVRSPSPPKVRTPVKVPERPEPPSKMGEQLRSPETSQTLLNPEPVMKREQEQNGIMGKSMVNGHDIIKPPCTTTNLVDAAGDQGFPRRKVVKVVRSVVRKILPTEEVETTGPTQPSHKSPDAAKPAAEPFKAVQAPAPVSKASSMSGFSFKHDVIKTEDKDDISRGLTNLMVRGRTRELRPQMCKDEHPKKIELEKKEEKVEQEETKEDHREDKTTLKQEVDRKLVSSGPVMRGLKSPLGAVNPTNMVSMGSAPASSKLTHSRPSSFPASEPLPLSPPPHLTPEPKPTPDIKPSTMNPLPATSFVKKTSSLSPPSRLTPVPKSSKLVTPVSPHPPCPNRGPLSPPPGVTLIEKPAESQEEGAPLSSTEEAQRRLMRIFSAPLEPAVSVSSDFQAPAPATLQPQGSLQGSVEEDPVALLQASHAAAKQSQVKTEEQIAAEQAWYGSEKVWLVHKDGFSLATVVKTEAGSLPEGKVKIKLEHDGTILDVDEDDIEKANPPSYDRSEDLASLLYLNESSVMHCLRQRYGGNLIHTYAGPNMVVINPLCTPSMYSEKVMHMFKGCRREDSAPHIYSVAQSAYRNLLTTRQDQSIVLLGKSGSGKTTNCQHLLQYLVSIAGSTGKIFSAEKWQAVYTILEAFGNSSTTMNTNASHFSHVVSLDFDQAGQVASASIQTMLLEKVRVSRRPEGESTFNIFYYILAGADSSLRTELHFNHLAENSAFGIIPHSKPEDKQRAAQQFTKLQAGMKVLGISGEEQKGLWLILGAIYHLGAAGATKDGDEAGRRQFARHEWAQKAAYLLGCTLEELSSSIFKHQAKGLQHSTSFRGAQDEAGQGDSSGSKVTALECLEAMASGLYSELFTLVISLINRALKSSQHSLCSLLIVDTPGFQNPRLAQQQRGATFEELCHNYTQERLQTLFHERTFVRELERYKEENIELALDDIECSTSRSVAAIDQASTQALVRTLARTDEARGLLWLMEEEAVQPGGSEETMLERLFSYYGSAQGENKGVSLLLRGERPHLFLLGHSHGTNWVEYDVQGWLSHAKHNLAAQNAATLLQDSQKKNISGLFMGRASGATVLSGSIAGLEGSSQLALRRATSMRKTFTTGVAAVKKKSLCIQVKLQVDALIDMVRRSRVHFVHCLLPKAEAVGGGGEPRVTHGESPDSGLMTLDVGLLRAQLRGSKLLDALRIYRQGYPDHMVFSEFRRRFDVLAPHLTKRHSRHYIVTDEKRAVEELLESLELEKSSYHMGLSRVFFRAGILSKLEEQRDVKTRRNISLFQAACRGYLARQAFKKRKIQDLAIRCIQKNIKKNRGVKDWPWWKLFTTVKPLIEVQLTEEQIRGKDEEIQQLKQKLEKVEKERNELRLNSDRLESRITELSSELADERNTGESASQLLETETSERLRLERDMKDLQAKFDSMKKQMESMEMEVMEARLIRASELNGEMDGDDTGGEWRLKYERAIREIEFTKKRLQQEFDDKLEVEQQNKRQLERRISDLQADNEESQRNIQQLKKKTQRLTAELQDTKLHLEGQQSRNHDLEKKQRKFDSELSAVQEEVQREKSLREKLAREKDMLTGEAFSLRQQLEDKDLEMCAVNLKLDQLEAELQDLNSQESKDEASLAKVKKQLRDMEAKVKDQEEELDEQAGTIQMLEQAKLRLEMEMERLRQTHSKEIESKDDEVEEIRQSCSKKLKQMEVQLEEEYDEKQKVLKEKRELESKLLSAQDKVRSGDIEAEKRLRKDLKRTKALLADAQIMLDHIKNNAPSKREIAQLKNQLEESEFTCAAAVKARKSMEVEIEDLHVQMEDISKTKQTLEEQLSRLQREKNDLQSRMEEDQEDLNELMKKHKAAVAQSAQNLAQISDLQAQLEEALKEKQEVQEKMQAIQSQLEFQEQSMVEKSLVSRQEAKIRELETKLEFEKTQVKRLESLVARLKENVEKLMEERDQYSSSENREKEQNKRLQRQIRDIKEEMCELAKKEAEASRKKHELEMDIESLEAGNQSLQADLKLAFKRIGDLQAAIEDEMESDDNEDLINSQGDSDTDSDVEDRVDGVKSWLSKSKGSAKNLSDDGSLKSSRFPENIDAKEGKEFKEGKEWKVDGKEVESSRPMSVMSSLSYRKRSNLDSTGGKGNALFSAFKENAESEDALCSLKAKPKTFDFQDDAYSVSSRRKSQTGDDMNGRESVISQAYSEANSRARKGLDKESTISFTAPHRASTHLGLSLEDDAKSTISLGLSSALGHHRSTLRLNEGRGGRSVCGSSPSSPCFTRRSGGRSPGSVSRADSRMSLARSCHLSEFDVDIDDSRSVAFTERSAYSPHSSTGRSFSMPPPQGRSSTTNNDPVDNLDIKPVSHRNYLDPDLEKAINEVLSFKPIKFKRRSLEDSEGEEEKSKNDEDDSKSIRNGDTTRPASSLRRSASAVNCMKSSHSASSCSSPHQSHSKGKSKKKKKSYSSESDSSRDDRHHRSSSKRRSKKFKKKSKKRDQSSSSSTSSDSESESSSGASTISYRSNSSVKRAPSRRVSSPEREREAGSQSESQPLNKKDDKKRKKKVDSLMMKYLFRPDSD